MLFSRSLFVIYFIYSSVYLFIGMGDLRGEVSCTVVRVGPGPLLGSGLTTLLSDYPLLLLCRGPHGVPGQLRKGKGAHQNTAHAACCRDLKYASEDMVKLISDFCCL